MARDADPAAGAGCSRSRGSRIGGAGLRGTRFLRSLLRLAPSAVALGGLSLLAACKSSHSALDPASAEARQISGLWWLYFDVTATVFVLVAVFLLAAIWRARGAAGPVLPPPETPVSEAAERPRRRIVAGLVVATIVILFGLLVADFFADHALRPPDAPDALTIKVTGKQWWWQLEYQDPSPDHVIVTANEIHVPVGRPILFMLDSRDVIHSFWFPSLQGKKDLVPGHPSSVWMKVDRAGTYEGQCAEFCGYQHAQMNLRLIAEPPDKFAAWQHAQLQSAKVPTTDRQRRGQQVFLTRSCVLCHTISGTPAAGRVGPPLSHIASEQMIGSNAFPNDRDTLARWILDAPSMKPGVQMPQNLLSNEELGALIDYLETLK